jgi:arginine transport system substrate-binding protein
MKKIFLTLLCGILCCCSSLSFGQTIRFGLIDFYPPFAFSTKSGYIHGYDVDVAKTICARLNAQCTFTPMPLESLFNSVNQGKVDAIIGAISITNQRKTLLDFSQPYFKSMMSYMTLTSANIDLQNLKGKRIGVVKSSVFCSYLAQKYGNELKVLTFLTNQELVTALSEHKVDLVLLDTPAASYWVNYSTGLFKLIGSPEKLADDQGYGIAVKKGNHVLLNSLNNALTSMIKDGTLSKFKQVYFKQ